MSDVSIRRAEQGDLPTLLDIYNHYVLTTPITFDVEPRTLDQRREWFAQFAGRGRHRCLVAVRGVRAIGWACSLRFKDRAAYDTTIETSIYLAPDEAGRGIGKRLYGALFEALAGEDIHRVFGGVTLPNDASVALHRAMGFEEIGRYPEVGRKFGRYWDVGLFVRNFA
jgi:phosphinothricin acetyltransferase